VKNGFTGEGEEEREGHFNRVIEPLSVFTRSDYPSSNDRYLSQSKKESNSGREEDGGEGVGQGRRQEVEGGWALHWKEWVITVKTLKFEKGGCACPPPPLSPMVAPPLGGGGEG